MEMDAVHPARRVSPPRAEDIVTNRATANHAQAAAAAILDLHVPRVVNLLVCKPAIIPFLNRRH